MVKISEAFRHTVRRLFPNLEHDLKLAQMKETPDSFVMKALVLALIFSLNVSVIALVVLAKTGFVILLIPVFVVLLIFFTLLFMLLPKLNTAKIRQDIEADIFVPARMLLTLLESGSSIVTALEKVSYTKAKSSKYFGKIASQIYLGKTLDAAIDEAVQSTPSESFRRVLQPIRKSLKTGTNIEKSLSSVLEDLTKEKVIEIEKYEKRLGALSLFYMIFGVIIPALSVVVVVVIMSVLGLKVQFFPFLFILLLLSLIIQFAFIRGFQGIRPLMRT